MKIVKKLSYLIVLLMFCALNLNAQNKYFTKEGRARFVSKAPLEEIEGIIRKEFVFKDVLNAQNTGLAQQIEATESVAIHIRRGDYLNNPVHNVFDISYIEKGIALLQKTFGDRIHLFIFSDDLQWCRENLNTLFPTISRIYCDGGNGKEDLQLMSMCKHFVIANSSFSWWAAWLGCAANKKVVAPQKWFNGTKFDGSDIIPKEWIKL